MKAIIVRAPGGLDRVERIAQPDPGPPGPGAIRVRLHASSLNFHDYGCVSAPNRVSDGRIPMSDGAGVVEAVGEGVTEFNVNDRVVSCFFPGWTDGAPVVADFSTVPGDGVDGTRVKSRWHRRRLLPGRRKDIRSPKLQRLPRPA